MLNYKVAIAGAVSGFVSAVIVDVHAWSATEGGYNWAKAGKRWIAGAVSGAAAAAGLTIMSGGPA